MGKTIHSEICSSGLDEKYGVELWCVCSDRCKRLLLKANCVMLLQQFLQFDAAADGYIKSSSVVSCSGLATVAIGVRLASFYEWM